MLPSKAVRLLLGTSISEVPPLSQDTNANLVRLVMAPFTPNENLVPGDLTFATFVGSAAKVAPLADAQVGTDPATGDQIITVNEPAGGWRFVVTDVTNLPQTIYGFAYLTATSAAVIATQAFDQPIGLLEVGNEINLDKLQMRMVAEPLS